MATARFIRRLPSALAAAALGSAAVVSLAAGETYTVTTDTFDQIIALLNERPDIPPALEPRDPARPHKISNAAEACKLELHDMVYSIPKGTPAPDLGPDRSTYEINKSRQPILLDPRGSVPATKGGSPLFVATHVMAVNSDGSPRSYHPRDAFGACKPADGKAVDASTPCAINWLCNAGVRLYDGARPIRCTAREDYQRAWDEMWGQMEAKKTQRIPESYFARDPNRTSDRRYGFFHPEKPMTVMFKDTIIPRTADYMPCVRDVAGGKYHGYFVTATSLRGHERKDEAEGGDVEQIVKDRRCNPIPFINAETLPNIVIPKGGFAGAKVGDLVVGYRKDAKGEYWVYGVVGDEGPNDKFGEASLAFNAALKGLPYRRWESYREIIRNLHIGDRNNKKETVGLLILRGTANLVRNDLATANVAYEARKAFRAAFGQGSIADAKSRFKACMEMATENE